MSTTTRSLAILAAIMAGALATAMPYAPAAHTQPPGRAALKPAEFVVFAAVPAMLSRHQT